MRLALLSDIHANLEALDAILNEGRFRGVESWICLGDIIGYGADPRACLDSVQQLTDAVILGNHDAAAIGQTDLGFLIQTLVASPSGQRNSSTLQSASTWLRCP